MNKRLTIRETFRTLRSLTPACIVLVVIVTLGIFFHFRSKSVLQSKIQEELKTAAAVGALQFSAEEIHAIHRTSDMTTQTFRTTVRKLDNIRNRVPQAKFAYIFRKTNDPQALTFVADADTGKSVAALDTNKNGVVDPNEEPGYPGESYNILAVPELKKAAFEQPTVTAIYTDQWGSLLSGFAPIVNANGQTVAVLGIDMDASEYLIVSQSVLSPLVLLLVFVVGVLMTSYIGIFVWKRRLENMQELDHERSRLMDLTLHQIGTPLSGMRWWVEILHDECEKSELGKHEAFAQLNIGIARMTEIIEALAKASQLRRKELTLHNEELNLRTSIESTVAAFRTDLTYREQRVILNVNSDLCVIFDRSLLAEVIQSLLKNAMYYSPSGSSIFIEAKPYEKNHILLCMRDEGYGISSEDLTGIFHQMRRGKDAMKQQPVGNGLGLYITKGIIEHSGGQMWIESMKGKGTSVYFTLPADESFEANTSHTPTL
ncbi:MAG: multi-sensor signal transduction histidine kinase [Candidatus Peribacteria bacterium]|nr:multi-sensor signal transduction histidine kinase [Candidatus Peribacteria bacterium]